MSNINGKAYAMNVVTPLNWFRTLLNRLTFWALGTLFLRRKLLGLQTLSLIHYARWVIIRPSQFPNLGNPREELRYSYMIFFSNFNGSWEQYVDSFSTAIPAGLDRLWRKNVKYPKSVPMQPFHRYITGNQVWTGHYYNAYPMAASNDVKSAQRVREQLLQFMDQCKGADAESYREQFDGLLLQLQHDLGRMGPSPIVSLARQAVEDIERSEDRN